MKSMQKKKCKSCQRVKLLEDFWICRQGGFGRYPTCRECESNKFKKRRKEQAAIRAASKEVIPLGKKRCAMCREIKPADRGHFCAGEAGGLHSYCRPCYKIFRHRWLESNRERERDSQKAWRRKNPEKVKLKSLQNKMKAKGIDIETYDKMLAEQGGVCAICGLPQDYKALAIDHDHNTGVVRGLLCSKCNHFIGLAQNNVGILMSAAYYLTCADLMNKLAKSGYNPLIAWLSTQEYQQKLNSEVVDADHQPLSAGNVVSR